MSYSSLTPPLLKIRNCEQLGTAALLTILRGSFPHIHEKFYERLSLHQGPHRPPRRVLRLQSCRRCVRETRGEIVLTNLHRIESGHIIHLVRKVTWSQLIGCSNLARVGQVLVLHGPDGAHRSGGRHQAVPGRRRELVKYTKWKLVERNSLFNRCCAGCRG